MLKMKTRFINLILVSVFFTISCNSYAQNLNETEVDTTYKDTTSIVGIDIMPEYKGGLKKFFKYVDKQLKNYSDTSCAGGRVYIKFIVDRKGVIREPYVSIGLNEICDATALAIIEGMPKWKPGKKGGKAVNCWHAVPIYFPAKDE